MFHHLLLLNRNLVLLAVCLTVLSPTSLIAQRNWIGAGAGGTGTDFNDASNWTGSGALSSSDDLIVNLTSPDTLDLSGNVTVNSLQFTITTGSTYQYGGLNVGSHTLTINNQANFIATNWTNPVGDVVQLDAGSGQFIFRGDVSFNSGQNGDLHFIADINNPGDMVFGGDVVFGEWVYTTPADEPDFIFDGAGTQNVTVNSTTSYIMGESVLIGQSNTPTVNIAGNNPWRFNVYEEDLIIAANCTLSITNGSLDNYLANSSSELIMGANSVLQILGGSTMPGGNIGFNAYASYALDPTSTVIYGGADQFIYPGLEYGNLELSGTGTKTSAGDYRVFGNMVFDAAYAHGSDFIGFYGGSAQNISGSIAPTLFAMLVNKSADTITSALDLSMEYGLQMEDGVFWMDGENNSSSAVIDINGGEILLTGGAFTLNGNTDTGFDQDAGTVNLRGGNLILGDVASHELTDYNLDGGNLNIESGTLSIADEWDINGGSVDMSGGTVNVAAFTGAGNGTAATKWDIQTANFNMTDGTINLLGAFDGSSAYPAMDLNGGSVNISGGLIEAGGTGSSDENFYLFSRGNAIHDLRLDKAGSGSATNTIWFEDFEDLSLGDVSDNGTTAWSTACTGGASSCGLNDANSNDYFQVLNTNFINGNFAFTGRDMDNEAVWTSESISISGYSNVSISIELNESGYDNSSDYINAYYSIDGGAETLLTDGAQSGNFNGATATASGLSGSNLVITIYMNNNGGSDYGLFDDVQVSGDIATSSNVVLLGDALDVDGDITIANGFLDVTTGNQTINLAGDWTSNGNLHARNASLTFDGGGIQNITNANADTFCSIILNKSSYVNLNSDIYVEVGMTMNAGNFNLNASDVIFTEETTLLNNESSSNYVYATNGGELVMQKTLNAPSADNPG
ncbi:MAG: hypothetical protein AAF206_20010, partial [Bacteroidota bacterium]